MSTTMHMPCTASCSGRPVEGSRHTAPAALAAPSRVRHNGRSSRRNARRALPVQASAAAFAGDLSSFSTASGSLSYDTLQQLASVLGFLIGAGWFAYQLMQSRVSTVIRKWVLGCANWLNVAAVAEASALLQEDSSDGMRECPTCGGSGTVECVCTRWRDGDVGCGICGGSGRMTCQ